VNDCSSFLEGKEELGVEKALVANSSGEGRWCGELEREYQILY
jgi:hypothetical protein